MTTTTTAPEGWELVASATQITPWLPPADLLARYLTLTQVEGYEDLPTLQAEVLDLREQVAEQDPFMDVLETNDIETSEQLEAELAKADKMTNDFAGELEKVASGLFELIDESFTGELGETLKDKINTIIKNFEQEMTA